MRSSDVREFEVLAGGDDERPARRWPWVVAAVVGLLVLAAMVGDPLLRARESGALVDGVAEMERALDDADGLVASRVAYASPLLTSASVTPQLRDELGGLVSQAAAEAAALVRRARPALTEAALMPWHGDLEGARQAYLDYVEVRLAQLDAIAADDRERARLGDEAVATDRAAARASLLAAVTDADSTARLEQALPAAG